MEHIKPIRIENPVLKSARYIMKVQTAQDILLGLC